MHIYKVAVTRFNGAADSAPGWTTPNPNHTET